MSAARLEWIAEDPAAARLYELAQKVAETSATILITGESGAGKDYLARVIHEHSSRRDAPFLKIDCASLPQELVESELFGHERGAFTGAVERKLGRFEMAGEGTIVLDEIAALSGRTQSKLLRVLEERTFERLGGNETLRIDARLIALTNADLQKAVGDGRFREDLFFRLNVVTLTVPPLRERPADILPIADDLLAKLAAVHGRTRLSLGEDARKAIAAYGWPGNIRELRNALERAMALSSSVELTPADLPDVVRAAAAGSVSSLVGLRSLEEVEREVIASTLEATHYKISKAAGILGISRKTLLEKRKRYGLR